MTDHTPLTDEELAAVNDTATAAMSHSIVARTGMAVSRSEYLRVMTPGRIVRLIADLRATRERIKELEGALEGKMSREEWYQDYCQW